MPVQLRFDPERPIYQQIIDEFKRAIARGELAPGDPGAVPARLGDAGAGQPQYGAASVPRDGVAWAGGDVARARNVCNSGTNIAREFTREMAADAVRRFVTEMRGLGFATEEILQSPSVAWRRRGTGRTMSDAIVTFRDVHKRFPGVDALRGVSGATGPDSPVVAGIGPRPIIHNDERRPYTYRTVPLRVGVPPRTAPLRTARRIVIFVPYTVLTTVSPSSIVSAPLSIAICGSVGSLWGACVSGGSASVHPASAPSGGRFVVSPY